MKEDNNGVTHVCQYLGFVAIPTPIPYISIVSGSIGVNTSTQITSTLWNWGWCPNQYE